MESKIKELKGILKSSSAGAQRSAADQREIAMHHARVLQHRKDVEASILESLVLLSEYPLSRAPRYTAAHPAPSDAAAFKTHVRLFQPSDYDDLMEERNVNGLCGYALCARPHADAGPGGEWKITAAGDIVRRRDVERWCAGPAGRACARRALFVKVQLLETAAWERAGMEDVRIDLLGEEDEAESAARQLAGLRIDEEQQQQQHQPRNAEALALERGYSVTAGKQRVKVTLNERETQMPNIKDLSIADADDHLLVEGHMTTLGMGDRAKS